MAIEGIDYDAYCALQKEIEELSRIKNHDYGTSALTGFGNFGIVVRLSDKFDRVKNFYTNQGELRVKDETIEDTLKDIINYSMYALLQQRGQLVKKPSLLEIAQTELEFKDHGSR